jgi:titin
VTGLVNGSQYVFRVAAVTSLGTGAYTGAVGPVTPLPLASAPTRLTGTAGVGAVSLVWTAPASTGGLTITDYLVQYSVDNGANWVTANDGVSSIARATVALPSGRSYIFRVAAITAGGVGLFSLNSPPLSPL